MKLNKTFRVTRPLPVKCKISLTSSLVKSRLIHNCQTWEELIGRLFRKLMRQWLLAIRSILGLVVNEMTTHPISDQEVLRRALLPPFSVELKVARLRYLPRPLSEHAPRVLIALAQEALRFDVS